MKTLIRFFRVKKMQLTGEFLHFFVHYRKSSEKARCRQTFNFYFRSCRGHLYLLLEGRFDNFRTGISIPLFQAVMLFAQLINIEKLMKFFNDCENQPVSNQIWVKFAQDSDHENDLEPGLETHQETLISITSPTIVNVTIEDYLSQEISGSSQSQVPSRRSKNKDFEGIFLQVSNLSQDRNTLKFLVRLFMKYHEEYTDQNLDQERIQDTEKAFVKHCKGEQGKITLDFQKYLFQQSPHSRRNRFVYTQILKNEDILQKELYGNGNVKNKKQYLHSIKVMRLRCKSAILAERAQTR